MTSVLFCFVLSLSASVFVTFTTSSAGTSLSWTRVRQLAEVKITVYNVLNMDIFLTKMHRLASGGLY